MQPAAGHGDEGVARDHPFGSEHIVGVDDSGTRAGYVVLVRLQQARVLGRLAAHDPAALERIVKPVAPKPPMTIDELVRNLSSNE